MKVVKRNEKKAPKEWSGRYICFNCESILDVEASDLRRYRESFLRDGSSWDYTGFQCPCCNKHNSVDVPMSVGWTMREEILRVDYAGEDPSGDVGTAKKVILRGDST